MRIGIDVDGVTTNIITPWLEECNTILAAQGKRADWTEADLTGWAFWDQIDLPAALVWPLLTPALYRKAKPYPDALAAVTAIRDQGHELVYITTCQNLEEFEAKRDWLFREGMLQAGDSTLPVGCDGAYYKTKAAVHAAGRAEWLVDDNVDNCCAWPGYALLVTRPFNRNMLTNTKRVRGLGEVPELLRFAEVTPRELDAIFDEEPAPFQTADKAHIPQGSATAAASPLPTDKQARKDTPITSGALDYFPAAIAEVARVSLAATKQHHPGQPMHWERGKSADHADCLARHLIERGTIDDDGVRHSAKAAWRALALLQMELEEAGAPLSRASRVS